jgi:hypothetical protein
MMIGTIKSIPNLMKHKKLLKSLDALSPELLGSHVDDAIPEQNTPQHTQPVKQDTRQIFQPVGLLAERDIHAYRGWGINE